MLFANVSYGLGAATMIMPLNVDAQAVVRPAHATPNVISMMMRQHK